MNSGLLARYAKWVDVVLKLTSKTLLRSNVVYIVPDESSILLATSPIRSSLAVYTFKAVIILDSITCSDLGLGSDVDSCKGGADQLCESLRQALLERDVISFISRVREASRNVNEEIAKSLEHELIHSYAMKNTSALFIAECCSWRVRFDNMYFMEKLYRVAGRDLARKVSDRGFKVHPEFRKIEGFTGLSEEEARKVIEDVRPSLNILASDKTAITALRDGFVHNTFLRNIIQPLTAPLVEVVTWYVMDEDLRERLEEYVDIGIFEKDLHGELAEKIIEELEEKRPDKQRVVEAANAALDFPQAEYVAFINRIQGDTKGMVEALGTRGAEVTGQGGSLSSVIKTARARLIGESDNFLLKRFTTALEGGSVSRAPNETKSFGRVLLYAIPSDKIPDFLTIFMDILREEGFLSKESLKKVMDTIDHRVGEYTAVYLPLMINGKKDTTGCNPLSVFFGRYISRTNSKLTTLELLVGDLVMVLRGFLTLGYTIRILLDQLRTNEAVFKELENYPFVYDILSKNTDVFNEISRVGDSILGLLQTADSKYAKDVIEAFIYTALRLGDEIRVLGGPHGLWFL